jgi:putative CocE/NonD family hydrolase
MTTFVPGYRVDRDVEIPMRDGVVLRGDVWLPDGEGPHAAILFRTPYNKAAFISDFLRPQHAVEAGFAVIVQDCRGRFRSDGEWRPLMWAQEGEDSYDTVEWAAAQSWCTGAVGMAGPSYLGIVQIAGAMLRPPHLKAIAPAICSVARHERPERGGAFWLDHLFGWTAGMTLDWAQQQRARGRKLSPESEAVVAVALDNPRALMDHRPLREAPLFDLPGFEITFEELSAETATPDFDVTQIDIPILSSGGWYDLYIRGTIGLFVDKPAGAERRVVIGPWIHSAVLPGYVGQLTFGPRATGGGAGLHLDHLAFFRRHLLGEDVDTPPVRYFLMGRNEWRTSATWPPSDSRPQQLFLRSGGTLSPGRPSADEGADRSHYDPADPTPTVGGRTMPSATSSAGPIDQAALAERRDVLRYESALADQPVDIVGSVDAVIFVQTEAPSFDIVVKLVDVAPDGVALPITDGIQRCDQNAGGAAFRRVDVSLADTAWRLRRGHRLRLQVQSANYPHFDANPGTGYALGSDHAGRPAIIGIGHAGGAESHVRFGALPF